MVHMEKKKTIYVRFEIDDKQRIIGSVFHFRWALRATLRAGSMIEEDILVTGNFGSKAEENFASMQSFFDEHGKKWPLMCMEILGWLVQSLEGTCCSTRCRGVGGSS